jgi:hypothetical protein
MRGAHCVIVKRVGVWWRVRAMYSSRYISRLGLATSHHRERADAMETVRVIFNRMSEG